MRSGLHGLRSVLCAGLVVLGVSALTLGGCGSGGGSNPSPAATSSPSTNGDATIVGSAGRGLATAQISLQWPDVTASRIVPVAAGSVKIVLSQNGQPIAGTERILIRPASGVSELATAEWKNLPVGDLVVLATAYPTADGAGTPLASASVVIPLRADQTKAVPLTLASTIDHLQITMGELVPATSAAPATIFKGDTLPIAVSALDKNGAVVLIKNTFRFTSSDTANAPVTVGADGATATLAGTEPTVTTVTVTETDSGKTTSVEISVTGFAVYGTGYVDIFPVINNAGWAITSFYRDPQGIVKPPYSSSTPSPLALPSGLSADTIIRPYGLNNKNQVVGSVDGLDASGNKVYSVFFQNEAGISRLLPFGKANGRSRFVAISTLNDNGLALFTYNEDVDVFHTTRGVLDTTTGAFTASPEQTIIDGKLAYLSFPYLTNGNLLLGSATSSEGGESLSRSVVSTLDGVVTPIAPLPGDAITFVREGNASGQVVGSSSVYIPSYGGGGGTNTGGDSRASAASLFDARGRALNGAKSSPIVWTASGGTVALPTLPDFPDGAAQSINDHGFIVGSVTSESGYESKMVLWVNNKPRDLRKILVGVPDNFKLNAVFHISDTNYITAGDNLIAPTSILAPVTRKP